jgi:hypothetical protein
MKTKSIDNTDIRIKQKIKKSKSDQINTVGCGAYYPILVRRALLDILKSMDLTTNNRSQQYITNNTLDKLEDTLNIYISKQTRNRPN